MVAPAAGADVGGGLEVHGRPRVEVVYEVDEEGFEGFGALGGAVFGLALVRYQDVREPEEQVFGKVR